MTSPDPGDMASALITPPRRHQRHRKGPADSHQRGLPRSGDRPWARTPPTASGPPHQPKKMTSITSVPPLWPASETPSPRKPRHIHTERSPAHARHRTPWTRRVRTETSLNTCGRPPGPSSTRESPPPKNGSPPRPARSCEGKQPRSRPGSAAAPPPTGTRPLKGPAPTNAPATSATRRTTWTTPPPSPRAGPSPPGSSKAPAGTSSRTEWFSGARWGLEGAEAILRLRAVIANGDFDAYWRFHLRREHERIHHVKYSDGLVLAV